MTFRWPTTPHEGADLPRLTSTDADFLVLVTPEGRLLAVSDGVVDALGWDISRCATQGLWSTITNDAERAVCRELVSQVMTTGGARMTIQATSLAGGRWLDVAAKRLVGEPGAPILVSARDVSDDVAAATQLASSELQWRVAFEHSPIGGALFDAEGGILVVNAALSALSGWPEHELTRMDVRQLVETEGGLPWDAWWSGLVDGTSPTATCDRMVRTSRRGLVWGRMTAAPLASSAYPARVVMQVEDITSRREAELELANQALHDGLTGAPNRFLTRQWLASALEDQPDGGVGVLYCDLDRFKIVNDSLGHVAGDDLLQQVTERLRGPLRPEDLLGRVGGDEFVMVVEGIRTPAELASIALRMAEALDEPFDVGGHLHAVTLSLGGTIGAPHDTADDVLMRADMALLRAKRQGRARYVAFDPAFDRVATKADLQLEDDLRVALQLDQLRAHYQPIVSLADQSLVGHEALVRWEHPRQGLLRPTDFLELAESSGLIRPLGWWMLAQACADAAQGRAEGWVAVNASPSQLTRPGVAGQVSRALAESGLAPDRLHLEITETALMTAGPSLAGELAELSDLGVRIALDDFGTGYSSLSLLRQFPVHVVKIDRSFVTPLLHDPSALAIVKAVLGMCTDMGLQTVAEGIETPSQLAALRELGCTHGQGFLFGQPFALTAPASVPLSSRSSS